MLNYGIDLTRTGGASGLFKSRSARLQKAEIGSSALPVPRAKLFHELALQLNRSNKGSFLQISGPSRLQLVEPATKEA